MNKDIRFQVILGIAALLGMSFGLAFEHYSLCMISIVFLTMMALNIQNKNKISELEKAQKQRIAIKNHSNLWFKVLEMASSKTLPMVDSKEWLKLNKECVETDYDYENSGMPPQSVNLLFIRLSYDQRETRLKIEELYKFHWGQLLEMIRNMNFPKKRHTHVRFTSNSFSPHRFRLS